MTTTSDNGEPCFEARTCIRSWSLRGGSVANLRWNDNDGDVRVDVENPSIECPPLSMDEGAYHCVWAKQAPAAASSHAERIREGDQAMRRFSNDRPIPTPIRTTLASGPRLQRTGSQDRVSKIDSAPLLAARLLDRRPLQQYEIPSTTTTATTSTTREDDGGET